LSCSSSLSIGRIPADAASRLARELRSISDEAASVMHAEVIRTFDTEGLSFGQLAARFGISKTLAHQIVRARDKAPIDEEEGTVTEPSDIPEPEPVVAAIVTSHAGVLIARRNDGTPPWTFIAGKIEPGESPADAAIREVKEETGLRIRVGGIIGRRVHPRTGRTMVYVAARPTHGTEVFVGDPEELAEVRWVTPDQAEELMGGAIYEPVRAHLRQTLDERPPEL
jgi:8-oxo-dGTP pyrophosphatase MutT (NUDIX family)